MNLDLKNITMVSADPSPRLAYVYSGGDAYMDLSTRSGLKELTHQTITQPKIQASVPLIQSMVDSFIQKLNSHGPQHAGAFAPIIGSAESSPPLLSMSPAFSNTSSPPQVIPYQPATLVMSPGDSDVVINIKEYPIVASASLRSREVEFNDSAFYSLFILLFILLILLVIFLYQAATF